VPDRILTQALDNIAAENLDLLITEYDFGVGGSVATLYCDNPIQAGSNAGLLTATQPGASTSTTGWVVGTVAAANYSRQTYNVEVPATNFTATVQPSSSPVGSAQDCWRISAITTGDFSAGTWYSSISVIGVTSGGDQDGRARFRLWKSINADGTGAVEITSAAIVGTTVTNLSTTVAQSSSASSSLPGIGLTNEYLFLQAAWEITGAGGAADRDVLVRFGSLALETGSGLITSRFSMFGAAVAALGGGAYFVRRRRSDYANAFDDV